MRTNASLRRCSALLGLGIAFASSCSSDETEGPIVGSGKLDELTTDVMFVEKVSIFLPFRTIVHNGEPRKLVVSGEDNLIDRIDVAETAVGKWKISAPSDLVYEQHEDVHLKIPYIDMVEILVDSEHVDFADDPAMVWSSEDED